MNPEYTPTITKSTRDTRQAVCSYVRNLPDKSLIHARSLWSIGGCNLEELVAELSQVGELFQFGPMHFAKNHIPSLIDQSLFVAGAGSGPAAHTAVAFLGLDIDRSSITHIALGGHSILRSDILPVIPGVTWHDRGPGRFILNRAEVALVEAMRLPQYQREAKRLADCLSKSSRVSMGLVEGVCRHENTW